MRVRNQQEGLNRTRRQGVPPVTEQPPLYPDPVVVDVLDNNLNQGEPIEPEDSFKQSNNYNGTDIVTNDADSGWRIEANGDAEFQELRARGSLTVDSLSTGDDGTEHVEIRSSDLNTIRFYSGDVEEDRHGFVAVDIDGSGSTRAAVLEIGAPVLDAGTNDTSHIRLFSQSVDSTTRLNEIYLLPHEPTSSGDDFLVVRNADSDTGVYGFAAITSGKARVAADGVLELVGSTVDVNATTVDVDAGTIDLSVSNDIVLAADDDITITADDFLGLKAFNNAELEGNNVDVNAVAGSVALDASSDVALDAADDILMTAGNEVAIFADEVVLTSNTRFRPAGQTTTNGAALSTGLRMNRFAFTADGSGNITVNNAFPTGTTPVFLQVFQFFLGGHVNLPNCNANGTNGQVNASGASASATGEGYILYAG